MRQGKLGEKVGFTFLVDIQVEMGNWRLDFGGDRNLVVIIIKMVYKATRLEEIAKAEREGIQGLRPCCCNVWKLEKGGNPVRQTWEDYSLWIWQH